VVMLSLSVHHRLGSVAFCGVKLSVSQVFNLPAPCVAPEAAAHLHQD
jgi:hypothetical protein